MQNKSDTSETGEVRQVNKRKNTRVSKIIPAQNYKASRNDAMPTPFNTIDEGYEADSDED